MTLALPAFAAAPVTTGALLLAQQDDGEGGGQGQDFGKSSPVGLLLLILFLIAVAFLVRSMTKHLKRVPASFDNDEPRTETNRESDEAAQSATSGDATPEDPTQPPDRESSDRDSPDGKTANGRT